jgi:manganese transport protein
VQTISDWMENAGRWRTVIWLVVIPIGIGLLLLLLWITLEPYFTRRVKPYVSAPVTLPEAAVAEAAAAPIYQRILVPLDHSDLDRLAVNHAAAMARSHGAKIFLLHVEEGVTSQVYGGDASTAEEELGAAYLEKIARSFSEQGVAVETVICHSSSPKREIVRYAREIHADLVIMGAHGHGGLKDLIFGNTINPVRHDLDVPMLIVRPAKN